MIEPDQENADGLNFLGSTNLEHCNKMAQMGTKLAHVDGGVPNITISIDQIDEYNLGQLFYFFEKSCGLSAYILGVNPFDQPGVESYKKNMFALLGKPGYEELSEELRNRLDE
jgi:glucose-6-phosphate isomerase